jgi:hypothetical protein
MSLSYFPQLSLPKMRARMVEYQSKPQYQSQQNTYSRKHPRDNTWCLPNL